MRDGSFTDEDSSRGGPAAAKKPRVVKTVSGVPRCPDGSWSLTHYRRCKLPMGHTGQHEYEVRNYGR